MVGAGYARQKGPVTGKCKHYSLDRKISWKPGAKEYHKHTAQQTSHKRFIGRGNTKRVAASAPVRNSRELNRTQGLYRVS